MTLAFSLPLRASLAAAVTIPADVRPEPRMPEAAPTLDRRGLERLLVQRARRDRSGTRDQPQS